MVTVSYLVCPQLFLMYFKLLKYPGGLKLLQMMVKEIPCVKIFDKALGLVSYNGVKLFNHSK